VTLQARHMLFKIVGTPEHASRPEVVKFKNNALSGPLIEVLGRIEFDFA